MTGTDRVRPRADLALIEGYHSPQLDVAVRLNTNESPYPPPAAWVDELAHALREVAFHRYPDRGAAELRRALGSLHGVDAANVYVANGSNEVLQALDLTYGGPGRRVAVFEPTYALHSHIARITGTEVVTGARAPDFTVDLDEVARVVREHRPEVVFLCSPNNPTGTVDGPDVVQRVVELAPGLVVVDEAYGQFAPDSAIGLVAEDAPVVVTRTFSKTWSMAATRLGYLVGPAWLVAELDAVTLPYHLDAVKQLAGLLALDHVGEMEARVAAIVDERERMVAGLVARRVSVVPSGANFVLVDPPVPAQKVWEGLVARGVLVRDCSTWPGLANRLRVTVGTPEETDALLAALDEVLDGPGVLS